MEEKKKNLAESGNEINTAELLKRLEHPSGRGDVVLDTDTFNEIDDQFALAYLICSREKLDLQAIYAAPFSNEKAKDPAEGMEKSYQEILHILTLMERDDLKSVVYRGSTSFLSSETEPVLSEAAEDLAKRAMKYTKEKPLYVVSIGAITNIASALLLKPEIRERIVVVWLGGHAMHWPDTAEFNMEHDIAAARIIFGCGVALVQLPCAGVVSEFATSGPELEYHLRGKNKLCDYLIDLTISEAEKYAKGKAWTRVIWDVTAVAWLLDGGFEEDYLIHSPIPGYDKHYVFDNHRHFIRYVYHVKRDWLFTDLFEKLGRSRECRDSVC